MLTEQTLKECQQRLGYTFHNPALLQMALTHSSGAESHNQSNERLEFLGDAVLGYVICETVFMRHPDEQEGGLTKIKSAIVSRNTCQQIALRLGLDGFLITGRGIRLGKVPPSLLGNVMEAVIAAIYLDGGMDAAADFIERQFGPELDTFGDNGDLGNFKSILQHVAQTRLGQTPVYRLLQIAGPEHSKSFQVSVIIGGHTYYPAWGMTKKEAEQRAAENAMAAINNEEPPYL